MRYFKIHIGGWIDYRQTAAARADWAGDDIMKIQSHAARQFALQLNASYNIVIALIGDPFSFLLGLAEAKEELRKRLEQEKPGPGKVSVETADSQITFSVRSISRRRHGVLFSLDRTARSAAA